jgi:hypothetical protein
MIAIASLNANLAHLIARRANWILPPDGHKDRPVVDRFVAAIDADIAAVREQIEARPALLAARQIEINANRHAIMTAAARANPESACYKCDGVGKIRAFSHIENGYCFACGGAGVRKMRRVAA